MKYIKSFENLKNLRQGTEQINLDVAKKWVLNMNIQNTDLEVFRSVDFGVERGDEIFVVDPKKYERKSAYTKNYYTILIDNSKLWEKYPKRKNSLICHTRGYNDNYGIGYRILPLENNSNWGICPTFDIWFSFNNLKNFDFGILKNFNNFITSLLNFYGMDNDENFLNNLSKLDYLLIDENINNLKNIYLIDSNIILRGRKKFIELLQSNLKKNIKIKETLEDLLDPNKNDFEFNDWNTLKNRKDLSGINKHEIWTDSKCLFLPCDYYLIENGKIL